MKKRVKKFEDGGYTGEPDEPLESVYPLEEMFLAGPVGKAVGKAGKAIANKVDMLSRPKVTNSIYSKMPGGSTEGKKYAQRYVVDPKELENIKESGYMLPKPGGKAKKYLTAVDEVVPAAEGTRAGTLRIPANKVPPDRAIRRKDIEMYDHESKSFKPLKKGGKVTASSRADGCAQRGKTRGRLR